MVKIVLMFLPNIVNLKLDINYFQMKNININEDDNEKERKRRYSYRIGSMFCVCFFVSVDEKPLFVFEDVLVFLL